MASWDPVSTGPARVAEQPCPGLAVALLLSQPLLRTLAIISFSLFLLPEEERSIVAQGHRLQSSSVSNFQGVNSLRAFLNSFPTHCPVLLVGVNVVAGAQVEKSFMALGLLTLVPNKVWDRTTVTLSRAPINSCFLPCLSR